jgi:hypothetical protein
MVTGFKVSVKHQKVLYLHNNVPFNKYSRDLKRILEKKMKDDPGFFENDFEFVL